LQQLILVNELDEPIGVAEKMEAHQKGLLHRAFSVFIFNIKGEMLLQQRAINKYHSGGLWTNACCSHPYIGQQILEAAQKRLQEEMGFSTAIQPAFQFTYKASFDNGLIEHEYDHVFVGQYEGVISPSADEVSDYCYKSMEDIEQDILTHPQKYTEWFKIALPLIKSYLQKKANTEL
jgi:isopentenyl-diphosphate delta-isomerase